MKERDVRGCKREGEGVCVTVCVRARHGGCDRPRAPQPCHLSSRKTTPDGNLCHGCWFKRGWTKTRRERRRRTDETCPRFMRGSERGARKDEMAFWMNIVLLIDQCGTSLILRMLSLSPSPSLPVVNVYSYISHHHSISHRGIQLFQSES